MTRSFLDGEQGTSQSHLQKISQTIDELAEGRRVVVVDGVGFPGVGSIVGVDNADVATAARAPVVLIGKSGVGGAIDSFNLNAAYFAYKGVPVLGTILNFGNLEGFSSSENCAHYCRKYFSNNARRECFYGVVPLCKELSDLRERISETDPSFLPELAELNVRH